MTEKFEEAEEVTVGAGYKTSWICKKVTKDNKKIAMPYKRPMIKSFSSLRISYMVDIVVV